jgi:hypothetical protein
MDSFGIITRKDWILSPAACVMCEALEEAVTDTAPGGGERGKLEFSQRYAERHSGVRSSRLGPVVRHEQRRHEGSKAGTAEVAARP